MNPKPHLVNFPKGKTTMTVNEYLAYLNEKDGSDYTYIERQGRHANPNDPLNDDERVIIGWIALAKWS